MHTEARGDSGHSGTLLVAAGLSLGVGIVHALVMPEHLIEWWGYGFFFMLAALAQLTYGLLLFMRPWAYDESGAFRSESSRQARSVYLAGAGGNLAIAALYAVTRMVGVPFSARARAGLSQRRR